MGRTRRVIERAPGSTLAPQAVAFDGVRLVENDRGRKVERPVVGTLQECLDRKGDFFDPKYGWLRAGGKKEIDPPLDDGNDRDSRYLDEE